MLRRSSSGRTTSLPPGLARARGEQGAALEAVRVDRRVPGRPVAATEHGARARRGARHPAPAVVQVLKHAPLLGTGVEHVHCGAAADRQSGQAASPRGITGVCQGPDCAARWDWLRRLLETLGAPIGTINSLYGRAASMHVPGDLASSEHSVAALRARRGEVGARHL